MIEKINLRAPVQTQKPKKNPMDSDDSDDDSPRDAHNSPAFYCGIVVLLVFVLLIPVGVVIYEGRVAWYACATRRPWCFQND